MRKLNQLNLFNIVPIIFQQQIMSRAKFIVPVRNVPDIQRVSFCFKYFINLGNDRFGSMTINENTDLSEEAKKFCKNNSLDPTIASLLEKEMHQEVQRNKEKNLAKRENGVGRITKNNSGIIESLMKVKTIASSHQQTEGSEQCHAKNSQKVKSYNCIKVERKSIEKQNRQKSKPNLQYFENLYRKHKQIENKKESVRRASIEKIPFKPSINNLSRKIVDLKRSYVSIKTEMSSSKIYNYEKEGKSRSKSKEITGKQKKGKENKVEKVGSQCKLKDKFQIK